jgi:sugar phosphate permease
LSQAAVPESPAIVPRFAHVLPLAFITYGLAFVDRVNYGSAEKQISASLQMSSQIAPVVSAIFSLGYCLFQIPAAVYATRRSVKWIVFWALLFWGGFSAMTGIIRSVLLLIADRVCLGAAEGIVLPCMLIYLTRWFTRRERSRSNSILMITNPVAVAAAAALSGMLIQHFDAHPVPGYQGWQMMFILEGIPSIVWAFVWLLLVDERPSDARWLSKEDAAAVQRNLDDEQLGIGPVAGYGAAFSDRRVIQLGVMFACLNSASYGLVMWLPGIVAEGTRRQPAAAGLLTSLPYFIAIFSMLAVSWASDRTLRRKEFVVASFAIGCAAFCASVMAGDGHFMIAFLGLIVVGSCIYTPTAPIWAWVAEMLPRNVAGPSMALINTFGAVGAFIGTMTVGLLKNRFHTNTAAFTFQAGCFAAAAVLSAATGARSREADRGFHVIEAARAGTALKQ